MFVCTYKQDVIHTQQEYLWYFFSSIPYIYDVFILHLIFKVCLYSTHYIPSLNGSLRFRKLKLQNFARPPCSFAFYCNPALNKNIIFILRF